jgi:hypothetical protein
MDSGFDVSVVDREIEIVGPVQLEQDLTELWAYTPVRLEGIDIGSRNTALKVALDVLNILGRLAVDIAREVEVERVLLDIPIRLKQVAGLLREGGGHGRRRPAWHQL